MSSSTDESPVEIVTAGGRKVLVTHPSKPYFAREAKHTKLDVVQYYLAVAEGALAAIRDRPLVLKRFVNGAHAPAFYQKRAPQKLPSWLRTVLSQAASPAKPTLSAADNGSSESLRSVSLIVCCGVGFQTGLWVSCRNP